MLNRRSVLLGLAAGVALPLPAFAQEKLPVVASFSILGDFVREIGGERVAVTLLVGPDGDAHVYSPTPADAKTVAGAKLVVVNGLKFEGWLTRLVKSSGTKATVATATKGIKPLKLEEAHDHDHGHDHGGEDPHALERFYGGAVPEARLDRHGGVLAGGHIVKKGGGARRPPSPQRNISCRCYRASPPSIPAR